MVSIKKDGTNNRTLKRYGSYPPNAYKLFFDEHLRQEKLRLLLLQQEQEHEQRHHQQRTCNAPHTTQGTMTIASVSSTESLSSSFVENVDVEQQQQQQQQQRRTPTKFTLFIQKVSKLWNEISIEEKQMWEQRAAIAVANLQERSSIENSTISNRSCDVLSSSINVEPTIGIRTKRKVTEDTTTPSNPSSPINSTVVVTPTTDTTTITTTGPTIGQSRQRRRCSIPTLTTTNNDQKDNTDIPIDPLLQPSITIESSSSTPDEEQNHHRLRRRNSQSQPINTTTPSTLLHKENNTTTNSSTTSLLNIMMTNHRCRRKNSRHQSL